MQSAQYGLNYTMWRMAATEMGYRTATAQNPATWYATSEGLWIRGTVAYTVRNLVPFANQYGYRMAMEPGGDPALGSTNIPEWYMALARKDFPGVDQNMADLAVWWFNQRSGDGSRPQWWWLTRFLSPKGAERGPAAIGLSTDTAFQAGRWLWRTGWNSIQDAYVNVFAYRFDKDYQRHMGTLTIEYNGPVFPIGNTGVHDWDGNGRQGFSTTMGFPEQGRSALEANQGLGAQLFDDMGYFRPQYNSDGAVSLTPGTVADYIDLATVKYRTTTQDGDGIGYLWLDLSRAFTGDLVDEGLGNKKKVSTYQRKIIYVPPTTPGSSPLRLFLFDSATVKSNSPPFEKRQTFILPKDPTIDGSASPGQPVRNGSGARKTLYTGASVVSFSQAPTTGVYTGASNRTWITPLTPAGFNIVKVQYRFNDGSGASLEDAYGRTPPSGFGWFQGNEAYAENTGRYRVEIIPTNMQLTDHLCTAIEVAPSASGARSTTQTISGTNFVGGRIGDVIGVHRTVNDLGGGTIVIPSAGTYKLFIGGLMPSNSRTFTTGSSVTSLRTVAGGASCASGCNTTSQGTIYLTVVISGDGTGAANTITISDAAGYSDTGQRPPAPPTGVRIIGGRSPANGRECVLAVFSGESCRYLSDAVTERLRNPKINL
jgi:hypothetical protein